MNLFLFDKSIKVKNKNNEKFKFQFNINKSVKKIQNKFNIFRPIV